MARVRSSGTSCELQVRRVVREIGVGYSLRRKLPGSPDLVVTSLRIAIFVDGCFWHQCPQHYTEPVRNRDFWRAKIARNVERDHRVNRELRQLGWRVVRIWDHELRDATKLVRRLRRAFARQRALDSTRITEEND